MLTTRRLSWGATLLAVVFALGCTGADGAPGKDGQPGAKGDPGDPGMVPPLTNDVSGTVTDENQNPLKDVEVTASPSSAKPVTTDANGAFSFKGLDIGGYEITFHLPGYVDQTVPVSVNLSGPTTVKVVLAVDNSGAMPPTITVADQLSVGFGASVTLQATASGGTGNLTYSWKQVGGPAATLTNADTASPTFTTQDFATAMGPLLDENARFGALGINPDQAGNYRFEVTVTNSLGKTTTATVRVDSTRPTTGLRMVPVGIPVWLQGDGVLAGQTQWNWTLDTTGATGSTATLNNPTSQFPSFKPDKEGIYVLTESTSGKSMKVYAGTWMGEMTQSAQNTCTLCHNNTIAPDKFTGWKTTAHYGALKSALDGQWGPNIDESTLQSLTVGYDKTAANNGFDDVEATAGWTFPAKLESGNYDTLLNTPKLGQLAGIQCENCHGPQGFSPMGGPHANSTDLDLGSRITWSSDTCSSCHQHEPYTYKTSQWAEGGHAKLELAYADATVESRGLTAAHCGRCHSAQGFKQYLGQLAQGYTGNLTSDGKPAAAGNPSPNAATIASLTKLGLTRADIQPQTCVACHDPHDATNPAQLRVYDTVPGLPNGMGKIAGAGSGMICIACHNTRNGEHSDFVAAPSNFTAPHAAAQTDVVYGFNAYYVPRYNPGAHLAVADSCAGCHYKVTTASQAQAKQTSNHSFVVDNTICANCHSANVDGEALQAVYQSSLDGLANSISAKILNLVNTAIANGGYTVRGWDPTTDFYSSASASNVALTVAPVSISHFEIHGQLGFIFKMPTAMSFPLVDGAGNPAGTSTPSTDLYLQAGSLKNAAAAATLIPATGPTANPDYVKSLWNLYLLRDDGTKGIHNPGFYNAVIAATTTKVSALP
jgi:hypothetical protein